MEESEMQSTLIAVDLTTNVVEIAVSRKPGKPQTRLQSSPTWRIVEGAQLKTAQPEDESRSR
jgi:hypothetical protein